MTGSTITTTLSTPVTIGVNGYSSPLTIAYGAGIVASSQFGFALLNETTGAYVLNQGLIENSGSGDGVVFEHGSVDNQGILAGGSGGTEGGRGIYALYSTISNSGTISGGTGVTGGGIGISIQFGAVTNTGVIDGGIGSTSGGTGVYLNHTTLINSSIINGGFGGTDGGAGVVTRYGGVVINHGQINAGAGKVGGGLSVGMHYGGTLLNYGDINGAISVRGEAGLAATIVNTGNINADTYGVIVTDGTVIDSGLIEGGRSVYFYGGSSAYNRLILDPGAQIEGVASAKSGAVLELSGTAGSAGKITGIGTNFLNFNTIQFDPGASWLLAGDAAGLAAGQTITGGGAGDTIMLAGFTATSDTYVSGTGLELSNGSTHETLDIKGDFSTSSFNVSAVAGGTEIVLCYVRGTLILTPDGERPVEDLRAGDLAVTRSNGYQPIKWIGRQNYAPQFLTRARAPVCITAGTLGPNTPAAPLHVSPGHSLLLGGKLILARNLINGITITQDVPAETVEYYAIELEMHDCVLANGSWAESYADGPGLRRQFHNADTYFQQFPDYAEPQTVSLCAPRPEAGPRLEAALLPLVQGLGVTPGPLRGYIESISADGVSGWAWDEANPDLPVCLEIRAAGKLLGIALACHYRGDLAEAGLGRGHCMFSFAASFAPGARINVHRLADGAELAVAATSRAAA